MTAGVGAAVLAVLGLEPQALAWSMVGAIFGAPLAPPAGRVRQALVFVAVVLACALLGTIMAEFFNAASPRWRNGWSMVLAGIFHPVSAALVKAAPGIVVGLIAGLAARRGGAAQDEGGNKP